MLKASKLLEYSVLFAETIEQLDFIYFLHKSKNNKKTSFIENWTSDVLENPNTIENDNNRTLLGRLKQVYCDVDPTRQFDLKSVLKQTTSASNDTGIIEQNRLESDASLVFSRASRLIIEEDSLLTTLFTRDFVSISNDGILCFHLVYLLELFKDLDLEMSTNGSYAKFKSDLSVVKLKSHLLQDIGINIEIHSKRIIEMEKELRKLEQSESDLVNELDNLIKEKRCLYTNKYMENLKLKRYFDRSSHAHHVKSKKCFNGLIRNLINEKEIYKKMFTTELDVFPVLLELRRKDLFDLKAFESEWQIKYDVMVEEINEKLSLMKNKVKKVQNKKLDMLSKYSEYTRNV
jgi:hypothetical protein